MTGVQTCALPILTKPEITPETVARIEPVTEILFVTLANAYVTVETSTDEQRGPGYLFTLGGGWARDDQDERTVWMAESTFDQIVSRLAVEAIAGKRRLSRETVEANRAETARRGL